MSNLKILTMRRRLLKLLLLAAYALPVQAQNFHWESRIDPALIDGFHRILLPTEVTSQLRPDFGDLRIYDNEGKEKAYLVYKDTAYRGVDRFVSYQIVDKEYKEGCCSHITVKNPLGNAIDHIVIEVNNADAKRDMVLSGSYDGTHWFAVKDRYDAVHMDTYEKGTRKTTSLLKFSFPNTDYNFYKFDFDDWKWWWHDYKYPVFVVRAGYLEPTYYPEETQEVATAVMTVTEDKKAKQSIVKITFPEAQYVDHLQFKMGVYGREEGDYYRAASLYELVKKDSVHKEERLIATTILSSVSGTEINLYHHQVRELVLHIANHDDQPLNVMEVHGFEIRHYLVADLSTTGVYVLRYGCDTLQAPVYDLQYFRAKVPLAPRIVEVTGPRDIFRPENVKTKAKDNGFFSNKAVIWIAIGVVGLLLAFMTVRMLAEMKKKE